MFDIELEGVALSYFTGKRRVDVLTDVTMRVPAGSRAALLGPSGGGKTSILNCIAGLVRPQAGTLQVLGQELSGLTDDQLADLRASEVSMVFQAFHLLPALTAIDNVALPLTLRGMPRAEARAAARDGLGDVGMAHRATHRPAELSGGEQQRVAIARALITKPKVLLADEPTGALDSSTTDEIMDLMMECTAERTLVLVTHDERIAERAGHVWRVHDGTATPRSAVTV